MRNQPIGKYGMTNMPEVCQEQGRILAAAHLLALWALTLGVSYVGSPGFAAGVLCVPR